MKKVKIFLDDVRDAPEGWIRFRSARELIVTLIMMNWDMIEVMSLDHDLGEDVPTGYEVLKYMENEIVEGKASYIPPIKIHSANPVGRANMMAAIESMKRRLEK